VLLAVFSWPICEWTKPSYRYNEEYDKYVGSTSLINSWYGLLASIFGFLVALSRMRDKLLRVKIYNIWMTMTCRQKKKVKFVEFEKIVQKTKLNTFLKTSLNTELVITILKGILILAASSADKIDHMEDNDMYQIKQTQTIELQKIKISDAKEFILDQTTGSAPTPSNPEAPSPSGKKQEKQGNMERMRILESDTEDEESDNEAATE